MSDRVPSLFRKPLAFLLLLLFALAPPVTLLRAQAPNYAALKAQAEKLYSDGSYALAREAYAKAEPLAATPEEKRWVAFRLADTRWRSQAATENYDTSEYDTARKELDALIRDVARVEDRDRLWVEVRESLADSWWLPRYFRDWGQAWPHYQAALDWWAGSSDVDTARDRYLRLIFKAAHAPGWEDDYYGYNYWVQIPLDTLQNALKIARAPDDRAHLHYLIASYLVNRSSDPNQRLRIDEEFEAALLAGKSSDWYDNALFAYAQWTEDQGPIRILSDGQVRQEPNYVKALALYKKLTGEFKKGESRYYDEAQQRIRNITSPVVGVSVSNVFVPGSDVQYHLNWRNVQRITLKLYPVDLTRDVRMIQNGSEGYNWLQRIDLGGRSPVRAWTRDVKEPGKYYPGSGAFFIDKKLPQGAYLLTAGAEGKETRDLVLVTDSAAVLKTARNQALVYFGNAKNGAPVANARVRLWERYHDGNWHWRDAEGTTNAEGIAVFPLKGSANNSEFFAAVSGGGKQAFSLGNGIYYSPYSSESRRWKIYAFTDRPAYRPGETAQWKFTARTYDGSVYSTPSGAALEYEITDPRGTKVKNGTVKLNAFGSAWGETALTEAMPLGMYTIAFWEEGRKRHIGSAELMRLEEYKLPEFKVTIRTPEEKGRKKTFRVGDRVQAEIQADYYFGGPVANATVEVVVRQSPYTPFWYPKREFSWFYTAQNDLSYRYYGGGQIVKQETLKTDEKGRCTVEFETPRGAQEDYDYKVEARVVDASRREIRDTGSVRVTRQSYYVYPRPRHCIYQPGDKVTVDLKSVDANDQPVSAEGAVRVTRERWHEIWVTPDGQEVTGDALRRLREKYPSFPPPPDPKKRGWRLKFRGYKQVEVLTQPVKTDAQGKAVFAFTPEREGFYRIAWGSRDPKNGVIRAEASVWAYKGLTADLGFRTGGLEIIPDRDTFQAGETAKALLTSPAEDRYALFSVEGDDLYSARLVHLSGANRIVEVPLGERHVPNVFLNAVMLSDGQIYQDTEEIVVPPVKQFLKVTVEPDKEEYQPRQQGVMTVTTLDYRDQPVKAEVALGLVDESVFYIQGDTAGDPRQFFYGEKRGQLVATQSTLQQKPYAFLDRRPRRNPRQDREEDKFSNVYRYADRDNLASLSAGGGGFGGGRGFNGPQVAARPAMAPAASAYAADATGVKSEANFYAVPPLVAAKKKAPGAEEPAVVVRSDFRSTVFWQPDVVTDAHGKATVKVTYPDSTTAWKATARVAGTESQFGIGEGATRTKQPLIVRLQAPRFFLSGDTVTVSAVINNNTEKPLSVRSALKAEGLEVTGVDAEDQIVHSSFMPDVKVPANGESRVDWQVAVKDAGTAKLTVDARAAEGGFSDAMERTYPVYEHGIDKLIAKSGKTRADRTLVKLDLPKERKAGTTEMAVQVTPSLAVTMLDALPYLLHYPYGCTEQTMSRFLPAAVTAKTLKDLGIAPETAMGRLFGGIEPESAAKTHPEGKRSLEELDKIMKAGLDRLYDFQHEDGGWGWWKEGESDHYMTAYVVWGLALARDAGIEVRADVMDRGAAYLDKELVEEETNVDLQAWMLHALAAHHASVKKTALTEFQAKAFENLWTNRDRLTAYTRAMLALSAKAYGKEDRAKTLVANLVNGVKVDKTPDTSVVMEGPQASNESVMGTAHWGADGLWWRWADGGIESTAFAMRALVAIDPENKLIEPVTNWLVKNRRGAQWTNTKDTAIAVLSLNDYLRQSRELASDTAYEVRVNGQSVATKRLTAADALAAPSRIPIDPKLVRDGVNEVEIVRTGGSGPLYFAAEARFFSLEEPVKPAGNEIFVRRQYFRRAGRPTLLKGVVYDNVPLKDGETVESGDRIECLMTIESKNDYEYLLFEDLKPAGWEAVEVRSGGNVYARQLKANAVGLKFGEEVGKPGTVAERPQSADESDYTDQQRWVYQELRDRKAAFFLDKLPQGVWEIRYELRAEVPGQFHALPVMGHAMYVPEIRCNGTETRVAVKDRTGN